MAPGPEEEGDEEEVGAEGLLWVSKDLIEKVSKAIEDKKEVSKDDVEKLIDSDEIADDALMVPCDMSVAADVEDVIGDDAMATICGLQPEAMFVTTVIVRKGLKNTPPHFL